MARSNVSKPPAPQTTLEEFAGQVRSSQRILGSPGVKLSELRKSGKAATLRVYFEGSRIRGDFQRYDRVVDTLNTDDVTIAVNWVTDWWPNLGLAAQGGAAN